MMYYNTIDKILQGGVQVPTGGKVREPARVDLV